MLKASMKSLGILLSGRGSNFVAIAESIDAAALWMRASRLSSLTRLILLELTRRASAG